MLSKSWSCHFPAKLIFLVLLIFIAFALNTEGRSSKKPRHSHKHNTSNEHNGIHRRDVSPGTAQEVQSEQDSKNSGVGEMSSSSGNSISTNRKRHVHSKDHDLHKRQGSAEQLGQPLEVKSLGKSVPAQAPPRTHTLWDSSSEESVDYSLPKGSPRKSPNNGSGAAAMFNGNSSSTPIPIFISNFKTTTPTTRRPTLSPPTTTKPSTSQSQRLVIVKSYPSGQYTDEGSFNKRIDNTKIIMTLNFSLPPPPPPPPPPQRQEVTRQNKDEGTGFGLATYLTKMREELPPSLKVRTTPPPDFKWEEEVGVDNWQMNNPVLPMQIPKTTPGPTIIPIPTIIVIPTTPPTLTTTPIPFTVPNFNKIRTELSLLKDKAVEGIRKGLLSVKPVKEYETHENGQQSFAKMCPSLHDFVEGSEDFWSSMKRAAEWKDGWTLVKTTAHKSIRTMSKCVAKVRSEMLEYFQKNGTKSVTDIFKDSDFKELELENAKATTELPPLRMQVDTPINVRPTTPIDDTPIILRHSAPMDDTPIILRPSATAPSGRTFASKIPPSSASPVEQKVEPTPEPRIFVDVPKVIITPSEGMQRTTTERSRIISSSISNIYPQQKQEIPDKQNKVGKMPVPDSQLTLPLEAILKVLNFVPNSTLSTSASQDISQNENSFNGRGKGALKIRIPIRIPIPPNGNETKDAPSSISFTAGSRSQSYYNLIAEVIAVNPIIVKAGSEYKGTVISGQATAHGVASVSKDEVSVRSEQAVLIPRKQSQSTGQGQQLEEMPPAQLQDQPANSMQPGSSQLKPEQEDDPHPHDLTLVPSAKSSAQMMYELTSGKLDKQRPNSRGALGRRVSVDEEEMRHSKLGMLK